MASGIKINASKVLGDFRRYTNATTKAQIKALDDSAADVKNKQVSTLIAFTKEPTGNLVSSISIKRPDNYKREIGPNIAMAPYAGVVEEGRLGTTFTGYHYVKNSIDSNQLPFLRRLERAIERPA